MKKIGLYILILGFILCAVVVDTKTMDQTAPIRHLIWAVVTAILMVVVTVKHKEVNFKVVGNWIFPLMLGYMIVSAVSMTKAINKSEALYEVIKIGMMMTYLFCAVAVLSKADSIDIFTRCMVVVAAVLVCIGVYQYINLPHPALRIGTMSNHNLFAGALVLLIPYCLRYRWLFMIPAGIIFVVLISLGTLSALVALVVVAAAMAVVKSRKWLYLIIPAFVVTVILCYPKILTKGHERFVLWDISMKIANKNILGIGAGNWKIHAPEYHNPMFTKFEDAEVKQSFRYRFFRRPHNDFLWELTETGIVGLGFYTAILCFGLYYSYKADKLMFMGIIIYIVFASLSYPRERVFHLMMLMSFLAISIVKYNRIKPAVSQISWKTVCLIGLILCSVSTYEFYVRQRTSRYFKRIGQARIKEDWLGVISEMDNYSPLATMSGLNSPYYFYRGEANMLLGNWLAALEDFRIAYTHNPNHIYTLCNIAGLYAQLGDYNSSKIFYVKAVKIAPDFNDLRRNLDFVNERVSNGSIR